MCDQNDRYLQMGPNTLKVPLKLFQLNRERLTKALKENSNTPCKSTVLLQGGDNISLYSTDVDYVFRQESYFMWAFAALEPGCYASLDITTGKSTLFVPRLPVDYEIWMGPLLSPADFKKKYGVDDVYYVDELAKILDKTHVLLLLKGVNSDSGLEISPANFTGIDQFHTNTDILYRIISELRVIKTDLELSVLRYVCKVSSDAHKEVMLAAKPNFTEYQAEATFLNYAYAVGGCRHVSYTCICGSGTNSAILHYGHAAAPNDRLIKDGDMCLFDMGANYYGYAADITCSFPVNGKFTPDQKLIYEAVLAANQAVFKAAKPGVNWVFLHKLAGRTLLEELKKGGLLKGNVDEMSAAGLDAIFQPHGLGHLLGLDVHDVGGYLLGHPSRPQEPGVRKLRMARNLLPGMVFTIEPGCYFIPPLLKQAKSDPVLSSFLVNEVLDRFTNFGGVRIEDDVAMTPDGVENLTFVPRTVEEIEAWMKKK